MDAIRLIVTLFVVIELFVALSIILSRRTSNPWKKVDIEGLRFLTSDPTQNA
jgi:hypothetical protein